MAFGGVKPRFKFNLKGISELTEMSKVVETLDKSGYEATEEELSKRFGFKIARKEIQEDTQNVN